MFQILAIITTEFQSRRSSGRSEGTSGKVYLDAVRKAGHRLRSWRLSRVLSESEQMSLAEENEFYSREGRAAGEKVGGPDGKNTRGN